MLGYGRDELVGRGARFLYASAAEHESGALLARNSARGGKGAMQSRLRRKDGGIIDVDITVVPVVSGNPVAGWVFAVADITVRKLSERALRESQRRLQILTRRLLEAQETERRSVARELHDEVGGVLTAVKLNLLSLRAGRRGKPGEAALSDGLALVDGAIQSVRSLSLGLRPHVLDDLGLIPALKWYCESQAKRSGVAIELGLDAVDLKTAPELESACFRIVQEAVSNALRHAGARHIRITLRLHEHRVTLEVADDGGGFEVAAARPGAGAGLLGMEERALLLGGRLSIDSVPGAGTRVRVRFSLPESVFA